MIDLGHLPLDHGTSVHDARNKIRSFAIALGYNPIGATRLAVAVSQAARELRRATRNPAVERRSRELGEAQRA